MEQLYTIDPDSNTTKSGNNSEVSQHEFDIEAQRAARKSVMKIDLFPDFPVALRKATGDGSHVDMLQHLVYWFHPRHKSTQKRWTIWKTYKEWYEECGLKRRRVDSGRRKLKALGLVTEKHGPHKRVFYRVDWVALAEVLQCTEVYSESMYASVQFNTGEDLQESKSEEDSLIESSSSSLSEGNLKNEKEMGGDTAAEPPKAPLHPQSFLLLQVRELLNPENDLWWGAEFAIDSPEYFPPEEVATALLEEAGLAYAGAKETLETAVRYVLEELREETGQGGEGFGA